MDNASLISIVNDNVNLSGLFYLCLKKYSDKRIESTEMRSHQTLMLM